MISDSERAKLDDWSNSRFQQPLTDDELRRLRRLLLDDDRASWLRKQVRVFTPWLVAAVSGVYAGWSFISGHWK